MKAIVYSNYGSPDVPKCEEIEKPTAGDDEVLIKVRAPSVNPVDWHLMRGELYFVRAMTGLRKPKVTRLGADLAGQVDAVGRNVTGFQPGDEVFGTSWYRRFALHSCRLRQARALPVIRPERPKQLFKWEAIPASRR
jgi:NADPH:quinone reductase-like Zn-dependent oxidoreductase